MKRYVVVFEESAQAEQIGESERVAREAQRARNPVEREQQRGDDDRGRDRDRREPEESRRRGAVDGAAAEQLPEIGVELVERRPAPPREQGAGARGDTRQQRGNEEQKRERNDDRAHGAERAVTR